MVYSYQMKRFSVWINKKEHLHDSVHKAPLVSEGDVWWAALGENVGSEVNGKSDRFSRPVIIFKKLAHGFYFVIPTSTKPKQGSWYVAFRHKGIETVACLHQARAIDYRRLYGKLGTLDDSDVTAIQNGFKDLYLPMPR